MIKQNRSGRAFLIFHLHVGARLALRKLAPVMAVAFAVYFFLWPAFFHILMTVLISLGSWVSGLFFTIISVSIASSASRRICHGLDGWIRHLPSTAATQRRLAGVAVFMAQIPILIVLVLLAIVAGITSEASSTAYLVGFPVLGLSSALCVLPIKQKWSARPLALAACISSMTGQWAFVAGSVVLLTITDLTAGPLSPSRKRSKFRLTLKGSSLHALLTWRALKLRVFSHYLVSLFFLGLTSLFISHNDFDQSLNTKAVCLGGALSLAKFIALTANMISARRPPWPWVRSLPWSARRRVIVEAALLLLFAIPLLILILLMNINALWPIILSLPAFVLFATQQIRQASEDRMGAAGKIFLMGTIGTLAIGLFPLSSLIFSLSIPLALLQAEKAEKSQKVSRWLELHHQVTGDSLSWSGR